MIQQNRNANSLQLLSALYHFVYTNLFTFAFTQKSPEEYDLFNHILRDEKSNSRGTTRIESFSSPAFYRTWFCMHLTRATRKPTLRSIHGLQSVPYSTYPLRCALSRWLTIPVVRFFGRIKSLS